MSYCEWTITSSVYQAYTEATARCASVYQVRALDIEITDCTRRESELWRPADKMRRRRIRQQREIAEEQCAKLRRSLRSPEQVAAEADAERREQEAEIAEQHRQMIDAEWEPRATERQIRHIIRLETQRMHSGDASGFMPVRCSSHESLARMTRREASAYITSLTGEY